jgi:hypothetical protein
MVGDVDECSDGYHVTVLKRSYKPISSMCAGIYIVDISHAPHMTMDPSKSSQPCSFRLLNSCVAFALRHKPLIPNSTRLDMSSLANYCLGQMWDTPSRK